MNRFRRKKDVPAAGRMKALRSWHVKRSERTEGMEKRPEHGLYSLF